MDRKARIVRFWLLVLAMLGAVVLCPELAVGLWPVAFFFPGCLCCGTPTCATACSSKADFMQLVVTGVVDGTCAFCASTFNGTALVQFNSGASTFLGACVYNVPASFNLCQSPGEERTPQIAIFDNGGTIRVRGSWTIFHTSATEGASWENPDVGIGAGPADCTTIPDGTALTYDSSFLTNGPKCDWSGSSATVNVV